MSERITPREIRDLMDHTESGRLTWHVDGTRLLTDGYLIRLRSVGGPILFRLDERGLETVSVESKVGLVGRPRLVGKLARVVEAQLGPCG